MLGDQTEIGRCAEESLSAAAGFVLPEIREMSAVMAMSVFLVITGNHLFGGGLQYCQVLPEKARGEYALVDGRSGTDSDVVDDLDGPGGPGAGRHAPGRDQADREPRHRRVPARRGSRPHDPRAVLVPGPAR